MPDNLRAPDQEEVERELRDLFDYGDIKAVAGEARISYSTLTKQLNPDCIEESIPYQFLQFLYGCARHRARLSEAVWALVVRHRTRAERKPQAAPSRFPSRLAFQVIERECNTPAEELAAVPFAMRMGELNELITGLEAHRDRLAAENGSHYESATNFREGYGGGQGRTRADHREGSAYTAPSAVSSLNGRG